MCYGSVIRVWLHLPPHSMANEYCYLFALSLIVDRLEVQLCSLSRAYSTCLSTARRLYATDTSVCGYHCLFRDFRLFHNFRLFRDFRLSVISVILCMTACCSLQQFGSQESGSETQIKDFCTTKYHVSFPMFSKVRVFHAGHAWLCTPSRLACQGRLSVLAAARACLCC